MLINSYLFNNLWTPAQITTALWLDAADASSVLTSGGTVSQWSDKSGNNRHATNATTATQPVYSSGSIVFTADRLGVPITAWPGVGYTVSTVMLSTATGGSTTGLINIDSNPVDDPQLRLGIGNGMAAYYNGGFAINYSNSAIYAKSIISLSINAGVSAELFLNGSSVSSGTRAGTLSAINEFTLGSYARVSGTRNGTIWKLLVYPSSLSAQQKVEGWMAWQEGLVSLLPAGHPYKSAAPTI